MLHFCIFAFCIILLLHCWPPAGQAKPEGVETPQGIEGLIVAGSCHWARERHFGHSGFLHLSPWPRTRNRNNAGESSGLRDGKRSRVPIDECE